jgi:putative transposase
LEVTKQPTMKRTTTRNKITPRLREIKELMSGEEDFLRPLVGLVVQEVLEAEMSEALGAQKGERTEGRVGYRSGYYVRSLVTRVGKLELRVPQDRQDGFARSFLNATSAARRPWWQR